MPAKSLPSLEDIEECETSLWLLSQLRKVQVIGHAHEDQELLDAAEYLIAEIEERWLDPGIATLLKSGAITTNTISRPQ